MSDENTTINVNDVTNPHDKLFRETWSNLDNARSFLHHYLPDHVLACMDLETLEISKDSFVEKELLDYYSDMLYKVTLSGKSGFVYVLFEHKSYYDRYVHLQLLEYMGKIWRLHKTEEEKRTPAYCHPAFDLPWKEAVARRECPALFAFVRSRRRTVRLYP
jgi:predicted transposase YdaD